MPPYLFFSKILQSERGIEHKPQKILEHRKEKEKSEYLRLECPRGRLKDIDHMEYRKYECCHPCVIARERFPREEKEACPICLRKTPGREISSPSVLPFDGDL